MKNETPRPFILQWRSAVLNSQLTTTTKAVLLALAEFADADGGNCFPSIPSVARLISVNERTARRELNRCESSRWLSRASKGTKQGWRHYEYTLLVPKGADTQPARLPKGEDTASAPLPATCGHTVQNVRTLTTEGAGTVSTDLSNTYPIPREEQTQSASRPADRLSLSNRFADFYEAYPRKDSRPTAEKAWKRVKTDEADAVIADVLASSAPGGRWHGIERRFIPLAATYLNGRRWEDEWKVGTPAHLPRDTRTDDDIADANEAMLARLVVPA